MRQQPDKHTPYDQFNIEIPRKFPKEGISAGAAKAIVNSETWTDANPMLKTSLSSSLPIASPKRRIFTIVIYPHTQETEFKCIR